MARYLFTHLQAEDAGEGRWIDALTYGTFIEMWGRKIEVEEDQLAAYLENTKDAIAATETESGELVGLPIDLKGHDEDEAAGWIIDVRLAEADGREVIQGLVKWTPAGVEAIKNNTRRLFSPTFDQGRLVIYGGSLTNWPASRDFESGITLLRPVELARLSGHLYRLQDPPEDSIEETVDRVRYAWWEQEEMRPGPESYVVEVFAEYVIIERSDGFFRVPYSLEEGAVTFDDESEWMQVRKSWIEMARRAMRGLLENLLGQEVPIDKSNEDEDPPNELGSDPSTKPSLEEVMTVKLEDLTPEEQESLVAQLASSLNLGEIASPDANELGGPLAKLIQDQATALAAKQIAEAKRAEEIVSLTEVLTGGTDEDPAGIPVPADELKSFLESLNDEQREAATKIFDMIRANGLVNFSSRGHNRRIEGKTKLEGPMKLELTKFLDADKDHTVDRFFEINAVDLGPIEDYDLAEFEPEKEG